MTLPRFLTLTSQDPIYLMWTFKSQGLDFNRGEKLMDDDEQHTAS